MIDDAYCDAVTKAVDDFEAHCDAELVVVFSAASGHYRDVDYLFGGLLGFVTLVFMVFNPWLHHDAHYLPVEVLVMTVFGAWLSNLVPAIPRLLTSQGRREKETRAAAHRVFQEEALTSTQGRTGLLLYYSVFEQELEIMPDIGVTKALPTKPWNELVFSIKKEFPGPDPEASLLAGIQKMASLLAEHMPASEDRPDEIPNRPRILV